MTITWSAAACALLIVAAVPANAQIVEAVGERALGMGGAFVAVANDSSATWWNPSGLADGPFFDLSVGGGVDDRHDEFPVARDRLFGFALSTPVIGASVYRLVVSEAAYLAPVGDSRGDRQDEGAAVGLRSLSVTSAGGTIVQTLIEGTHVGATLKYVRGTARIGVAIPATGAEAALDQASDLAGGEGEGRFDFDIGALTVAGPVRLGLVVRNVLAPEFADGTFTLPLQARVGVAVSAEQVGGPPLTVAVDADVKTYHTGSGPRRVVAVGAEHWLAGKRVGLRGGARFNQVGQGERAFTAGASLALRAGSYLEAHLVGGGSPAERGWGTGFRVSF